MMMTEGVRREERKVRLRRMIEVKKLESKVEGCVDICMNMWIIMSSLILPFCF